MSDWPDLTPRQQEVLEHLLDGLSEQEVADRLLISPHTVHNHVKALYRAFDVSCRLELLSRCLDTSKVMALSAAGGRRSGGEERDPAGVSEKERHARRILQNTPDFILEFDPQGTIRFINRVFPFHEREDVIGTNAEDWLPPGDLEHFRQALQAALATGRPQECTLSIPGMSEGGAPRLVHARLNRVQKDGERRVIVVSRMVDRGDRVSPPFE